MTPSPPRFSQPHRAQQTVTTFVDLFAGAGGLTLGLVNAGWKPMLAVENWREAVETYRHNFKNHKVFDRDISELTEKKLRDYLNVAPDWVVGGPPCTGFSTVGKRDREDPRNSLVNHYARIVEVIRPNNFLIENVLGIRDMGFVQPICRLFRSMGYSVAPMVVCSADFGVPQLRRRVIFVGDSQGRLFDQPRPTHAEWEWVTVWDAIGDLPEVRPGEAKFAYDKEPFTAYQRAMCIGSDRLQGHEVSDHPTALVEAISYIPDGGNRQSIPPHLQPKSGFHNSYSRLNSREPAVAVTQNMGKPSGTRCIHPKQHRGLTAREGARLQGFPDRFHFKGGIVSQRLQIANAVSPVLARALGIALSDANTWARAA
jgi:DNA (cytosine-5)-methyltransferase 1